MNAPTESSISNKVKQISTGDTVYRWRILSTVEKFRKWKLISKLCDLFIDLVKSISTHFSFYPHITQSKQNTITSRQTIEKKVCFLLVRDVLRSVIRRKFYLINVFVMENFQTSNVQGLFLPPAVLATKWNKMHFINIHIKKTDIFQNTSEFFLCVQRLCVFSLPL